MHSKLMLLILLSAKRQVSEWKKESTREHCNFRSVNTFCSYSRSRLQKNIIVPTGGWCQMHSEHSERINSQSFRVTNRPPIAHFRTTVSPLSIRMSVCLSHYARPHWRSKAHYAQISRNVWCGGASDRQTTFVAERETATAINYVA